jgi:hypothetical protein
MAVRCKIHGLVSEDKCYFWHTEYKGRKKIVEACKQCTKDRRAKKYAEKIPKVKNDIDWTGQKFGSLTFIQKTDERHNRSILWKLKCECGEIIKKRAYFVIRGITDNCGCKTSSRRAIAGAKSRKLTPEISSAKSIWMRVYKDGCDFETFFSLSKMPCTYCGKPPHRTFNKYNGDKRHPKRDDADFTYNGLDRLDNSKDHSSNNVVPCCTSCNISKGTKSVQEFLDHVRSVYAHSCTPTSKVINVVAV